MKKTHNRHNRRGVLTMEWLVLVALLVVGVITGVGQLRHALLETADVMPEMVTSLNNEIEVTP